MLARAELPWNGPRSSSCSASQLDRVEPSPIARFMFLCVTSSETRRSLPLPDSQFGAMRGGTGRLLPTPSTLGEPVAEDPEICRLDACAAWARIDTTGLAARATRVAAPSSRRGTTADAAFPPADELARTASRRSRPSELDLRSASRQQQQACRLLAEHDRELREDQKSALGAAGRREHPPTRVPREDERCSSRPSRPRSGRPEAVSVVRRRSGVRASSRSRARSPEPYSTPASERSRDADPRRRHTPVPALLVRGGQHASGPPRQAPRLAVLVS